MTTRRIIPRSNSGRLVTPNLGLYFGVRNRHLLKPQLNLNFVNSTFDTMMTRKEADLITHKITSLFDQPFNLLIQPPGVGDLVFAMAESNMVDVIYIESNESSTQKLLINNISTYHMQDRVTFTSSQHLTDVSVLVSDVIKDSSIDIAKVLADKEYPIYAFRVAVGVFAPESKDYDVTIEETGNAETSLLIYTQHSEEGVDISPEWLDRFIPFLDHVLSRIIPSPKDRQAYLDPSFLSQWIQAFTHQTIDPNFNYEVMEMLGDRSMKFGFADYLIQRIPTITESQLTELQNYYLTTIPQSNLSRSLGFGNHVRIIGEVKPKVLEDVLEAFFGSLFRVSEDLSGGRGYYNVFSMIVSLYRDEPLEVKLEEVKGGRDKTVFQQILAKLRLDPVEEMYYDNETPSRFTVQLTDKNQKFFRRHQMIVPKSFSGIGTSKKAAENYAYTSALSALRQAGVTSDWIEEQRNIFLFDRPEYQPYLGTARARLQRDGFTRMTFSSPPSTSTTNECIVQLIGQRPDKSQHVLATTNACDRRNGRVEVLRQYASGI